MESFNIVMRKDCLRMKRIGMLTSGGDCQAPVSYTHLTLPTIA